MNISDILQLIAISGSLFFLLGYFTRAKKSNWYPKIQRVLFKPRYLQSTGFLIHGHLKKDKKK